MTLTRTHVTSGLLATLCTVGVAVLAFAIPQTQASTTIGSGDLIRGESFSAVYYVGADGFRYVFPNDKTYATWYSDFGNVKFISDADLAKIQIGGNVTYKAESRMIKIDTDPRVYFVEEGGMLRAISDEATALAMYGADWSKRVDDVPDGFFSNYTVSDDEISLDEADVTVGPAWSGTINDDKDLYAPFEISITDDGFSPDAPYVTSNQDIRFTNYGTQNHTATAEDGSWGTGTLQPGQSFIVRNDSSNFPVDPDANIDTYTYFDSYNSAHTGTIVQHQ